MGKYDCDQPELRLRLGSGSSSEDSDPNIGRPIRGEEYWHGNALQQHQHQHQQDIAIFYNGRICVCDVTEIQARAIICIARREMEERIERSNAHHEHGDEPQRSPGPPLVLGMAPQLINPELSMKRSLQRFLQKRKTRRMDASSPYRYAPETPSPSSSSSS